MNEPKPPEFRKDQGIKPEPAKEFTRAQEKLAAIVKDHEERSKGKKLLSLDVLPTQEYITALDEVNREKEENEARLRSERLKREFGDRVRRILNQSGYIEDFLSEFQSLRKDTAFQDLTNEDIAEVLRENQQHIQGLVNISIIRSGGDLKKFEEWKNILENLGIDFSKKEYDDTMRKFLDRKALKLCGHWWTSKDEFVTFTNGWFENGWRAQGLNARLAIVRYNKNLHKKMYE